MEPKRSRHDGRTDEEMGPGRPRDQLRFKMREKTHSQRNEGDHQTQHEQTVDPVDRTMALVDKESEDAHEQERSCPKGQADMKNCRDQIEEDESPSRQVSCQQGVK